MPGAKHSSLKALSPSNYGSVKRKRRRCLLDPSDPSLYVQTGKESSTPINRARASLRRHLPTPHAFQGDRKFLCPASCSLQMDKRAHLCPQTGTHLPVLKAQQKEQRPPPHPTVRWEEELARTFFAIRTNFISLLHMQAKMDHVL